MLNIARPNAKMSIYQYYHKLFAKCVLCFKCGFKFTKE